MMLINSGTTFKKWGNEWEFVSIFAYHSFLIEPFLFWEMAVHLEVNWSGHIKYVDYKNIVPIACFFRNFLWSSQGTDPSAVYTVQRIQPQLLSWHRKMPQKSIVYTWTLDCTLYCLFDKLSTGHDNVYNLLHPERLLAFLSDSCHSFCCNGFGIPCCYNLLCSDQRGLTNNYC